MTDLPQKIGELHNHHFDSEKWEKFPIRDDDIIIATAYKSGTTWMQNIVLRLIYQSQPLPANSAEICPWLDLRVPPIEVQIPILEAVKERRQLKTHLPLDKLKFYPKNKYIYIARDGRDCFVSLLNHYRNANELMYQILNDTPGLVGEKMPNFSETDKTDSELFEDWLTKGGVSPDQAGETDGWPWWSLLDHVSGWWKYRHLPNILMIHYSDMLADLEGSVRKIAAFLEIPIVEESFPQLVESVSFSYMKKNAKDCLVPLGGAVFKGGAETFIHKGTNGRWKDVLTEDQVKRYEELALAKCGEECANWLANGTLGGK